MKNITRLIGVGYLLIALAAAAISAIAGPIGYAPAPITLGPPPEPVTITVWYSSEKRAWLTEAVARFEASGARVGRSPIKVALKPLGSREIAERVASQSWGSDGQPTVISPASSMWLELLRGRSPATLSDGGAPLALTPLVLVSWDERARYLWPQGQSELWGPLHDALVDDAGWPSVVARAGFAPGTPEHERARSWGTVKLGHTSPLTSNSGTQTLLLMAYAFHSKTSGLSVADVQSEAFATWLRGIERGVPKFGESTGAFTDELVRLGPSQYDVVATYENLAIESIAPAARWGTLKIFYPPATIFSDHPYAILSGQWVSADQRAAAEQLRSFLLSRPIQELALQSGFRPADPGVPISSADASNPFTRYQANGVRTDLAGQVATPTGEVIEALLQLWQREVGR